MAPPPPPQPSGQFGGSTNGSGAGTAATSQEATYRPRTRDYRLRGLDLGDGDTGRATRHQPRTGPPRRHRRRRFVLSWAVVVAVAVGAAVLVRGALVQPYSVPTAAMVPTLQVGDSILAVKSGLLQGSLQRGDIVVFTRPAPFPCTVPRTQGKDLVQRIIGLPGDTIWSSHDKIYVDGRVLNEKGWYNRKYGPIGDVSIRRTKVAPRSYFVMGDNRLSSCDSRAFGTIPRSAIVGKVIAVIVRQRHLFLHFF